MRAWLALAALVCWICQALPEASAVNGAVRVLAEPSSVESVRGDVLKALVQAVERRSHAEQEGLAFAGLSDADRAPCEVGYDCRGGKCMFEGCGDGGLGVEGSVGCSGGKCVFRDCESPTCRGGGCTFLNSTDPTCGGGRCHFVSTVTVLRGGACDGGGCTLDGWPYDNSVGRRLAE